MATISPPDSINGTGFVDVSQELTEWGNTAPNPGDRMLITEKYRCESGWQLYDMPEGSSLEFAGDGQVGALTDGYEAWMPPRTVGRRKWPRNRPILRIQNAPEDGFRIVTPFVTGPYPDAGPDGEYVQELEGQHAIEVDGGLVFIDGGKGGAVRGDLLYVTGEGKVWAHKGVWRGSGRQGVAAAKNSGLLLDGVEYWDIRRSAIDFEPPGSSGYVHDAYITRCLFRNFKLNWLASKGTDDVNRISLVGNVADYLAITCRPPSGTRRHDWSIRDNVGLKAVSSGSNDPGTGNPLMEFMRLDDLEVTGNKQRIRNRGNQCAVGIEDCTGTVLEPNEFEIVDYFTHEPTGEYAEVGCAL